MQNAALTTSVAACLTAALGTTSTLDVYEDIAIIRWLKKKLCILTIERVLRKRLSSQNHLFKHFNTFLSQTKKEEEQKII